jgi:hypothetical protein
METFTWWHEMKPQDKPHLIVIALSVVPLTLRLFLWPWWQLILMGIFILSFGEFYLYLQHERTKELLLAEKQKYFIDAYRLIKVLLMQSISPYQSLQTILPFVHPNLAQDVHTLLLSIDQDKSIFPYLQFANRFHSLMIEQLMFALYQLENQGGGSQQLQQFQYLFDQADQQHYQGQLLQFHEQMQNANGYVMAATGLIAFSLLVGVIQLIAGMIYGI